MSEHDGTFRLQPVAPRGMSDRDYALLLGESERNRVFHDLARQARLVRGRDISELKFEIARLKTEGLWEEALDLAYDCADAEEKARDFFRQMTTRGVLYDLRRGAGSWYKEVAIILRKLKDYEAEVRYLEYVLEMDPEYTEMAARLAKARQLAAKQSGAQHES